MTDLTGPCYQRRQLIAMGLAGASALCTGHLFAASDAPLITKAIPATGQRLPVIGVGGRDFGDSPLTDIRAVLQRLVELGGSIIDTAASYGDSEQAIGQIVSDLGIRSKVFLATKLVGGSERPAGSGRGATRSSRPPGFGAQVHGEESFNRSLERLKTDYVDLLQVHNLSGVDTLWPLLTQWKQAGKIRYIGMTTSSPDDHTRMLELMRQFPVDFIEVDYSIGDRDAAQKVFALATERKIAVMADVPLGAAGRGGFRLSDVMRKPLPSFAAGLGARDWPQLMLKYVISHPAVTCTVAGATKLNHLQDDQEVARGVLLDAAMRKRIEEYWD